MAFTQLLTSFQQCGQGAQHLDVGPDGKWKAVAGMPGQDESYLLERLIDDLYTQATVSPLPLSDLDSIESSLRKLTLAPPPSGILGVFSRTISPENNEAFKRLGEVKERHIVSSHLANFESIKKSFDHLVKTDDLLRFTRFFRAIYLPEVGLNPPTLADRTAFEKAVNEELVSLVDKYPNCLWIKRVPLDPDWACSLVPIPALYQVPKLLDLKGCSLQLLVEVIESHKRQKYSTFKMALNCSQGDLIQLAKSGQLHSAIELDLRESPCLEWNALQPIFAKMQALRCLWLPPTLAVPKVLEWDPNWNVQLKTSVVETLTRIQQRQQALSDCTFVSNLMKGIEGKSYLSRESRIAVSFLVSRSELFKTLPQLEILSASGIQKMQADIVLQAKFINNQLKIGLCYCPNITKEGFRRLFEVFDVRNMYLRGCSQVDDSYFEDHPLLCDNRMNSIGVLHLTATSVSQSTYNKLHEAHPDAQIFWDGNYLPRRAKMQRESFGVPHEDLSPHALQALLHLKYTGYFPLVSLDCSMELIRSQNRILAEPTVMQQLKDYCRYILQLNVDRSTVRKLFLFAQETQDPTLQYICRSYIQTFYSPENPEQWKEVSDAEIAPFEAICKQKNPPEPTFAISNDLIYRFIDPATIHFSIYAAPLFEQVQYGDIFNFCKRFAEADPATRLEHLQRLAPIFPQCRWLQAFARRPQSAIGLGRSHKADLRDFEASVAIEIIKGYELQSIELVLNCSHADFHRIMEAINKKCIKFLDIRGCTNLTWSLIEHYLLQMPSLTYVLLPLAFHELNPQATISTRWSNEWRFLLALNILHNYTQHTKEEPDLRKFERSWYYELKHLRKKDLTTLLQKEAVENKTLLFSNYTQVHKNVLLECPANCETLSLFGASHVDDSFLPEKFPESLKKLDLRGTKVSPQKVEALRRANITVTVKYDTEYLPSLANWHEVRQLNFTKLSQEAFDALTYFNFTGYFPFLTMPVAKELLSYKGVDVPTTWRLIELQEYCIKWLAQQINGRTVRDLYYFAHEIQNDLLQYLTYYFVEVHFNPYKQEQLSDDNKKLLYFHQRISVQKFYDENLTMLMKKQSVLPLPPRNAPRAPDAASSNFNEKEPEDSSGL